MLFCITIQNFLCKFFNILLAISLKFFIDFSEFFTLVLKNFFYFSSWFPKVLFNLLSFLKILLSYKFIPFLGIYNDSVKAFSNFSHLFFWITSFYWFIRTFALFWAFLNMNFPFYWLFNNLMQICNIYFDPPPF